MTPEDRQRVREVFTHPAGERWPHATGDVATYCDPVSDEITLHHVALDPIGWAKARRQGQASRGNPP